MISVAKQLSGRAACITTMTMAVTAFESHATYFMTFSWEFEETRWLVLMNNRFGEMEKTFLALFLCIHFFAFQREKGKSFEPCPLSSFHSTVRGVRGNIRQLKNSGKIAFITLLAAALHRHSSFNIFCFCFDSIPDSLFLLPLRCAFESHWRANECRRDYYCYTIASETEFFAKFRIMKYARIETLLLFYAFPRFVHSMAKTNGRTSVNAIKRPRLLDESMDLHAVHRWITIIREAKRNERPSFHEA